MRILHVIASMNPVNGGPSQGIRNLDVAMQPLGVKREIVCADAPDSPYLATDPLKIHALGSSTGPWRYESHLAGWLADNIGRFELIVINGIWLYNSYAAWKALTDFKKKYPKVKAPRLLVMPHGMLDPYFQHAKERRLKAIRNWVYWKLIERKIIRDADGLLFTTQTELILARKTFTPYQPKKEYNVGYGIAPPAPFKTEMLELITQSCPKLDGEPYILFLSRIHLKKGVDLLIKAYTHICASNLDKNINIPHLVIAGPGMDSNLGHELTQQLAALPEISNKIHFAGMLSGDGKWGAFYGCEAFILPSHQENFGIAVAEALACGKPVLISDQVNIWREIMDGKGGFIAPDTLEGTIDLLQRWISTTKQDRKEMGENAKAVYERHFMVSQIAKNFFEAYTDIN